MEAGKVLVDDQPNPETDEVDDSGLHYEQAVSALD